MPGEKGQNDNPGYVTRAEFNGLKDEIRTIRTALVGEDYRKGIVKDVTDLKKDVCDLKKTRSATRDVIKSMVVSIVVAVVTAWIITGMPH